MKSFLHKALFLLTCLFLTQFISVHDIFSETGSIEEAKTTLEIAKKKFGPYNINVVEPLDSLASLYASGGRYTEAEPLLKRELAIRTLAVSGTVKDKDYLDISTILKNLADVYMHQQKHSEAEVVSAKKYMKVRTSLYWMPMASQLWSMEFLLLRT